VRLFISGELILQAFFIKGRNSIYLCNTKKRNVSNEGILESSVADPDAGSGAFLTPGSGIRDGQKIKISDPQH
jgi:hypothetical protein